MLSDTNIFGYMRFSFLGRSDAILSRIDFERRIKLIYSEARMAERFYLLENICLPSLRWQSDQNFRLVIFSSPEMPDKFKDRLKRATSELPQIEVVYDDSELLKLGINSWMQMQPVIQNHRTAHFRLDDDDALSTSFIAKIRETMAGVPNKCIITMPKGLLLAGSEDGGELLSKYEPHIAIGFTLIQDAGTIFNPYQLRHLRHHEIAPSLSLPQEISYIHTAHRFSDTVIAHAEKVSLAREYHTKHFGNKPRRFSKAVKSQFNGHGPSYFEKLIAATPSNKELKNRLLNS